MKRTKGMLLRLTPEELNTLTKKAKRTFLSREEFCRQILNGSKVFERPNAMFYEMITELKDVGSKLDLIIKMLENKDSGLDLSELHSALESNWQTEKMLWDTFLPKDS